MKLYPGDSAFYCLEFMMCKAVCVHSPGGCCRCLTSPACCPLHQPSGVRGDCSFLQSIWASSQEMRKGKRGPAARAEATGLLRLGSEQGMPRASRGAQGLCTACQRLESHWAADPRASLRERTHLVRTQENFVQFFTLFSVFFNFSEFVGRWSRALFTQTSPWHLKR